MDQIIITGASAGIGTAFAHQLAKQGHNLILVARRTDKLDALAQSLIKDHGIEANVITCDLSTPEGPGLILEEVEAKGWSISGLINNAGFGLRGAFAEQPLQGQLDIIQVNMTSLVSLTHKILPKLTASKDAFIINVASTAAFQAGPGMATYFASKAFVLSFTEALRVELAPRNITVSALCPGATDSEFAAVADMADTMLFKNGTMTSDAVVRYSLANRKKAIVIPGLMNKITVWSTKVSPRSMTRKIAGWLLK